VVSTRVWVAPKVLEYSRHHSLDFFGAQSGEGGCGREYDEPEHGTLWWWLQLDGFRGCVGTAGVAGWRTVGHPERNIRWQFRRGAHQAIELHDGPTSGIMACDDTSNG
jgi:hypothetical protein